MQGLSKQGKSEDVDDDSSDDDEDSDREEASPPAKAAPGREWQILESSVDCVRPQLQVCLLYTSDAADE